MTIPVSTVPAAKAWLFGELQTNLAGDGSATFGVGYAPFPDTVNNPDDMVWLADTTRTATPWTLAGGLTAAQSMQETYDLSFVINCYRGGDQAEIVEDRAFTLLVGVEDVVRTDPTFGGLLIRSYPNQAQISLSWDEEFKGRLCVIQQTISCLASL